MAYTYRSSGTPVYAGSGANIDLSGSAPSGVTTGDLLLLFTGQRGTTTGAPSITAGWTLLKSNGYSVAGSAEIYARIATGDAADAPSTVDWSGTAGAIAWLERWDGGGYTDLATIVAHSASGSGTATTLQLPAFTPATVANCLVVGFSIKNNTATDATTISHSVLTKHTQYVATLTARVHAASGSLLQTTATDYAGADFTVDGTSESLSSRGVLIYLKSAETAPDWTAVPSVSSQTATVYTIGFTPNKSSTIYGVAVVAGSAAPSIAQVKAGQNGSGGAAAAANNKAVTGADTLTLDMGGSPSPTYDLYFVLNNTAGDSSRQSIIGAPIGSLSFSVAATVTSQTTTVYTIGFTPSAACTIYGVAVLAGSTQPSIAQVKAGQNGSGGTPKAANSKAVTGADSFTLTPSDSPAFPRYDLYCVLNSGATDSSIRVLASEYLDAPAGKQFSTLALIDATSPFYAAGAAANDTVVIDTVTDPNSYVITCTNDGTVIYEASGDTSRQLIDADVYDYSVGAYIGAGVIVFNNFAPDPGGFAFNEPLLYQKNVAITPIALTNYAPDPEADTVTVTALDALPTGLSISSSTLSGTPTVYGQTNTQIQWEDQYGATYTETVTIQVGEVVPDVIHTAEGLARGQLQAVASFTTTTSYTADAYVAIGDVISTDPVAGTLAPYDQVVSMLVSNGSQAVGTGGSGFPVGWQGKRKKLTLKQQPNKHLKKLLDDEGKKVLARRAKKKPLKVEPIKLWP